LVERDLVEVEGGRQVSPVPATVTAV
jgi:hypothetical protein